MENKDFQAIINYHSNGSYWCTKLSIINKRHLNPRPSSQINKISGSADLSNQWLWGKLLFSHPVSNPTLRYVFLSVIQLLMSHTWSIMCCWLAIVPQRKCGLPHIPSLKWGEVLRRFLWAYVIWKNKKDLRFR